MRKAAILGHQILILSKARKRVAPALLWQQPGRRDIVLRWDLNIKLQAGPKDFHSLTVWRSVVMKSKTGFSIIDIQSHSWFIWTLAPSPAYAECTSVDPPYTGDISCMKWLCLDLEQLTDHAMFGFLLWFLLLLLWQPLLNVASRNGRKMHLNVHSLDPWYEFFSAYCYEVSTDYEM